MAVLSFLLENPSTFWSSHGFFFRISQISSWMKGNNFLALILMMSRTNLKLGENQLVKKKLYGSNSFCATSVWKMEGFCATLEFYDLKEEEEYLHLLSVFFATAQRFNCSSSTLRASLNKLLKWSCFKLPPNFPIMIPRLNRSETTYA